MPCPPAQGPDEAGGALSICLTPGAARGQRWRARNCPRHKRRQQRDSASPRMPMERAARPLRKRGARRAPSAQQAELHCSGARRRYRL
eukprot:8120349-Pyramimonas_sp.AAC.1